MFIYFSFSLEITKSIPKANKIWKIVVFSNLLYNFAIRLLRIMTKSFAYYFFFYFYFAKNKSGMICG